MNYYEIHPNKKKRKRVFNKKTNLKVIFRKIHLAIESFQYLVRKSQPIPKYAKGAIRDKEELAFMGSNGKEEIL